MIDPKVISSIKEIIFLEDQEKIDYDLVQKISLEMIKRITDLKIDVPKDMYRYLDDFDIRKNDIEYKKFQTARVINILIQFDVF